ncbi:tyrosine phosphatase [Seminavis robusta]|uniref:Tyrosine phosphatase n=1 Tax=Seminavis robusta TaxID=568900 RepID=A0A9N8H424_9STRA|nr:tyrosine phosphatase [Seminavis robusta]|eukprot:Sro3_g002640.1 tyrosine phosphatase (201) ;mRNA; r:209829-210431
MPNQNSSNGKLKTVTVQPPRPNDCTYWVTESLLAGEYPTDRSYDDDKTRQKLRQYLQSGITYFVDLTREGEKLPYADLLQEEAAKLKLDVVVSRFAIPDFGIPQKPQLMEDILTAMDTAIDQEKRKVYVHCRGGIGRTGTTVGCYLARHGYNTDPEEALQATNQLFQNSGRSLESSVSPETDEQMDFVRQWAQQSSAPNL